MRAIQIGTAVTARSAELGIRVKGVVRRISPEADKAARWLVAEAAVADASIQHFGAAVDVVLTDDGAVP